MCIRDRAELLAVGVVGLGAPLDMGAGVGLVLGDDLIGMFIAQHMAGEVGDHKADGGVPEAALSAEEAASEAELLSEAEPPQPASMAADIASAIERASAFFIFVFLLFV